MAEYHSFTTYYEMLVNRLTNTCTVKFGPKSKELVALWDTGATITCISEDTVKDLEMVPTGMMPIKTPSGSTDVNTYLADIILPNGVTFRDVKICDSKIGEQGFGLLIGMDIISAGEMAISSLGKKTTFSFRVPAKEKHEFAKEGQLSNLVGPKHGRGKRKKR